MKIKCEYCSEIINDYDEYCPNCKKANVHYKKVSSDQKNPETIDELKQWYIDRNLPPENTTRFFIGTNYQGAKAFGIYKDEETGEFIVYKNKSDGSRAVRYRGKNEQYAVNEIYLKLREEISNQKRNNGHTTYDPKTQKYYHTTNFTGAKLVINIVLVILIMEIIMGIISFFLPQRGYYLYNDDYYYYQNGSWYEYSNYNGWQNAIIPIDLKKNYRDYYQSSYYDSYYNIDNFEYSGYYEEPSSSSDWDSSDSWDSGSTDWDSDW